MNIFKLITGIFDELYGQLTIPVFFVDSKGRLLKVNKSFLDLTGARPADIQNNFLPFFLTVFKKGMPILKALPEYHTTKLCTAAGNSIPVDVHYVKLKAVTANDSGALGFINNVRELDAARKNVKELNLENKALKNRLQGGVSESALAEQKKLEQKARDAQDFLESVVEASGDGIVTVRPDGGIIDFNKSFAAILGRPDSEIKGACIYEFGPYEGTHQSTTGEMISFDQAYCDYHMGKIEELRKVQKEGGMVENWEYYVFNGQGDVVPVEVTATFKKDVHGRTARGICCVRDITARKKSEKALVQISDLMRANSEKEQKIATLNRKLQRTYNYGNIIGSSQPMRKMYQLLEAIKDSEAPVLITGETGTGKELIANAIHFSSPRSKGPMISVNCGAIPAELMEREFFGHVRGAYTGATESRKGYFSEADSGTLFLDEIGELQKDMQVKLLRALEQGSIMRVGDAAAIKVNVRLIAATNSDLQAAVQMGTFRRDLYYRLYVLPVHVPPLRERTEDIPMLIQHFMRKLKTKTKKELPPLTEKALRCFMNYAYPGNVRELEHMIERFCLLGGKADIMFFGQVGKQKGSPSDFLSDDILSSAMPLKTAVQKAKLHAEREVLRHVLEQCNNNYEKTAKRLNICLASLYNKLKNL